MSTVLSRSKYRTNQGPGFFYMYRADSDRFRHVMKFEFSEFFGKKSWKKLKFVKFVNFVNFVEFY